MLIHLEDETNINGKKVRGLIVFDAVYEKFSDAVKLQEVLIQAQKFIVSQLPDGCTAVASDSDLNDRRGVNKRVDLRNVKLRSG